MENDIYKRQNNYLYGFNSALELLIVRNTIFFTDYLPYFIPKCFSLIDNR